MTKIKIKCNGSEMKAFMFILHLVDKYGERNEIDELAAMELLQKLFLRLFVRVPNFKAKDNKLNLTLPEAWAITFHMMTLSNRLESYEWNTWIRISGEINKQIKC